MCCTLRNPTPSQVSATDVEFRVGRETEGCFRVLHLELSHSNDKIHAKYSEIFSIETENRHIIENTLGKDIFCRDIPELSTCSKKIEAEVRPWRLELAGF